MELTTIAGFAAVPFLMVVSGWIFTLLAKLVKGQWDQSLLENGLKITIVPLMGMALGVLAMFADTDPSILNPPLVITTVSWVKYLGAGFMMGAGAIGLNQIQKGGR
uniref:Uncharacterized protein n=1 Tax=viral metagenome TaxID=1070528 RepID=A0A6M3LD96_9ZZZZ